MTNRRLIDNSPPCPELDKLVAESVLKQSLPDMDLREIARSKPAIEFTAKIDEVEDYAQEKMRARLLSAEKDSDGELWKITVSYEEFEDHNRPYETSDFTRGPHEPTGTAREAGYYKIEDKYYIEASTWYEYFFFLDGKKSLLLEKFAQRPDKKLNYGEWLENIASAHFSL